MYSAGAQKRIMLIHDATQELPANALRRVLHVFSMNPGDKLSILGVFQLESKLKRINGKNRGNRSIDMDVTKKQQYETSWEIMQVSKLCDTQKVCFYMEIISGPSRNFLAVEAAKKIRATWVILDRKMKKDKNYFLKNLSCGISKIKQHDCITQIRGPVIVNDTSQAKITLQIPVCTEDGYDDDDLFSIEISPATRSEVAINQKAISLCPPGPLWKGILPHKKFTDSINVENSIDVHQLQWLFQLMRTDPHRTISMDKVIPMLQVIFDYPTSNEDFRALESQTLADAITARRYLTSEKECNDLKLEVMASSPSSTGISNSSSEYEFISFTKATPGGHALKREISKPKRKMSYSEMIC